MKKLRYFWTFLIQHGPMVTGGRLCTLALTACYWAFLLAGGGNTLLAFGALLGTAGITAQITAWWPPQCPCGVRHWDEGDDEDDDSDEYGMTA